MNPYKTAFLTGSVTYVALLLAELIRPGFVVSTLSPHWLLLVVIIAAFAWTRTDNEQKVGLIRYPILAFLSITLAIIIWKTGESLTDMRIIITLIALLLPWTLSRLITTYE